MDFILAPFTWEACIWTTPLLVCNCAEGLTALLVWNVACNLGTPLSLGLLFCLPISNASSKDTKVGCFSHFAILYFKDNGLSYFFPSVLGLSFIPYTLCLYGTAINLLSISCLQTHTLCSFFHICSLTLFLRYAFWVLPWKFGLSFPELTSASLHSLTVYSQIVFAALQRSACLLTSKRDLSGVSKNSIHFR